MIAKELRAQRAAIVTEMKALTALDAMTDEQSAHFDKLDAEQGKLLARAEKVERASALEAEMAEVIGARAERQGVSAEQATDALATEKRVIRAMLIGRDAVAALPEADRTHLNANRARFQAAGTTATGSSGGYTIDPVFVNELLIAQKALSGVRQVARNMPTSTGAPMTFVTMDDTGNSGALISENTQITADTDLAFAQVTLGSYNFKSGVLLVPLQLLQDSAFDFDTTIRDAMALRMARTQNPYFTTGTGSSQPQGVVTAAGSGKVGPTGQATSITFDDLVDLEHSIDPIYRRGASYMFKDSTLLALKKLKDGQNRPLWRPSIEGSMSSSAMQDTINGYPYAINTDMAAMAANAKSVLFGDFSAYIIRDVLDVQMIVLRERYADYLQVGYIAYQRTDAKLITAASPIKYYANSAT